MKFRVQRLIGFAVTAFACLSLQAMPIGLRTAIWNMSATGSAVPVEPPAVEPVVTNTITYVGLEGAANPNPTQFTTNDLPLVLSPIEREGWAFLGWMPNEGVIPAGTVTNVTFVANWEKVVEKMPDGGPYTEIVNGVEWTYTVSDGEASVLGADIAIGAITIPSTLGGCPVTSIGWEAFSGCSGLTSVAIPSSVTSIGDWAFYGCPADCEFVVAKGDAERVLSLLKSSCSEREYRVVECKALEDILPGFRWDAEDEENERIVLCEDDFPDSGRAVRLSGVDDSETWVEKVVTNDVRVSFAWKASCEAPMLDEKDELCFFDRLEFCVDGEAVDAVAGEEGWSVRTFDIWGEGEHRLRWAYVKDESDSEGDDCGWLADVEVEPYQSIRFTAGDDVSGDLPETMKGLVDDEMTIPTSELAWPRHRFVGWSDGQTVYATGETVLMPEGGLELVAVWEEKHLAAPEILAPDFIELGEAVVTISAEAGATIRYTLDGTDPDEASSVYTEPFTVDETCTIKAVAVREDFFDSEIATKEVVRLPYTFGEYLGMPDQEFTTSGDADWSRVQKDGRYALRSGAIGDSQTSTLSMVVSGSGTLNFVYSVSSEAKKGIIADGLALYVDDCPDKLMWDGGVTDWKEVDFDIVGDGEHVVRWVYSKNGQNSANEDCAWIDEVRWTPIEGDAEIVVDDADGFIVLPDGKDVSEVAIKVIRNGYDIFPYLKLPAAVNGVIDLSKAGVKVEIVQETLDVENGAVVTLDSANPVLTTAPTRPGLTYTLFEGSSLEGLQPGASKVGDGQPWTPDISVKGGTSAFYSIRVEK